MILTKIVLVSLHRTNIKHFANLNYIIPRSLDVNNKLRVKKGTFIKVKVKDLLPNSHVKVLVKCDNTNCISKPIWLDYQQVKKSGEYLCINCYHSGQNSHFWNPNLTNKERKQKHNVLGINKWRNSVKERDNYTCQCCGSKDHLFAHHLNNFSNFKEQRTDIDNGITLCKDCHAKFHKIFGFKHTTKEMFEKFIENYKTIYIPAI